jgi:hypothetical protein
MRERGCRVSLVDPQALQEEAAVVVLHNSVLIRCSPEEAQP